MINEVYMVLRSLRKFEYSVGQYARAGSYDFIAAKLFDPSAELNNEPNSNLREFESMLK